MEIQTLKLSAKKNLNLTQTIETTDKLKRMPSYVKSNKQKQESKIRIKTQDGETVLSTSNILYCQADNCYSIIYIAESKPLYICKILKKVAEKLIGPNFVRCHDSYLVNIDFIKRIKGKTAKNIELIDGTIIPCSRRKLKDVINAIDGTSINISFSDN